MENIFGKSIIPEDEPARLSALYSYQILDSSPEPYFNNLALLMAQCFKTPIALLSLVDKEQVFFKANVGMPGTDRVSRGISLCSLAILEPHPIVFENALTEPCLLANPLVAGSFGLRFYAGAPIITSEGHCIGTACVVDRQPRKFDHMDRLLLTRFAASAMKAIVERKKWLEQTAAS